MINDNDVYCGIFFRLIETLVIPSAILLCPQQSDFHFSYVNNASNQATAILYPCKKGGARGRIYVALNPAA